MNKLVQGGESPTTLGKDSTTTDHTVSQTQSQIGDTIDISQNARNAMNSINKGQASDGKRNPEISMSNLGVSGYSQLENKLDNNTQNTIVVVRCWNKSQKDLADFIEKLKTMKKQIPSLKGVFISINNEQDNNTTESNLLKALQDCKDISDIALIPIGINGYSWTSGLNGPAGLANEMCLSKGIDRKKVKVINMSFGVNLDENDLEKCNGLIEEDKRIVFTARRTSTGENPLQKQNKSDLQKKLKKLIQNPTETELAELAYVLRNTFNIISLEDIVNLGGFNPLCNGDSREFQTNQATPFFNHQMGSSANKVVIRGMEDSEFFIRLILSTLKNGDSSVVRAFHDAFNNPIFYHDYDWNKLHELAKIKKIGNEIAALSLIISGLARGESVRVGPGERKTIQLVSSYVPGILQDFKIRKA